ncbi:MAG: DUF1266 domain-containing protein [Campylobacter sp.]|nr:DUF1266 domain-containing protein [Campylobacter sp.]
MRDNQNPANIFQVMYKTSNLDRIFISDELARDRIFSVVESHDPRELKNVANDLSELYDVVDKQSLQNAVDNFDSRDTDGVLDALLRKAYNELGDEIIKMNYDEFSARYLDDATLKSALDVFGIKFEQDEFESYKTVFKDFVKICFGEDDEQSENQVPDFVAYCKHLSELYKLCENTGMIAYNFANIFNIISKGYAVGYIDKKEYDNAMTLYADAVKGIFSGFDEYFASYLLGYAFSYDEVDLSAPELQERVKSIYIATNSPFDMLAESRIWSENLNAQKSRINQFLAPIMDMNANKKDADEMELLLNDVKQNCEQCGFDFKTYQKTLDIYITNVKSPLLDYGVELMFNIPETNGIFTPLHELSDEYSFYGAVNDFCKKTKFKFSDGEFPIIVILDSNISLVTNKAIHIYSGMMFFKKLKSFAWIDVEFKAEANYMMMIKGFVDKENFFGVELQAYQDLTGKKFLTEDEQNALTFKDETTAIELTFNNLKRLFR